jgi:hypothetical protein
MTRTILVLASSALFACDPAYTLHLSTKVSSQGAPVAGAWVIPLARKSGRLGDGAGVKTGTDGGALLTRTEFLRHPIQDPIGVRADDRPLCVVRPASEVTPRGRGWFFVTEFDADLAIDLGGAKCADSKRVTLSCGDECEVVLSEPTTSFCDGFVVVTEATSASAELVSEVLGEKGAAEAPHAWRFARPKASRVAFVALCTTRAGATTVTIAE